MSRLIKDMFKREEISVAHEMIEQQHNDYVVNALNELFEDLIQNVKTSKSIKKASDLHKDANCLNILNKIDYTLKERFGIETKFVAVDNGWNCGVLVSNPRDVDTIQNDMFSEVMSELKATVERYNLSEANTKAKKEVQEMDMFNISAKDNLSLIYNYRKSITTLRDKLKTSSIIIDRKKAKIIGLPNEFIAYLQHDLYSFIKKIKYTAEELTATFLHEMGHAFTYIEYSYRSVTNTSVLIDTFLENLDKKNKAPKDSLILAYEKVSGDTSSEYKTKDAISATIYMLDSYLKENKFRLTGSAHPGIDAEQLADQFAGRFGMGQYIITGLEKFRKEFESGSFEKMFDGFVLGFSVVVAGGAVIALAMMSLVVETIIAGIAFLLIILALMTIRNPFTSDNDPGYTAKYDDVKQRYKRIRNEAMRSLRTNPGSKTTIETTIANIDKMDEVLKAVPDAKVNMMDAIIRKLSSSTKHRLEIRTIERMIEDLSENNLYLASAKLQSKI